MRNKKIVRCLVACIALMFTSTLFAQTTSTKNTYSIYSMYGIGDIATQGTLSMRSMGGAGVASRSSVTVNLLNPASLSMAIPNAILLDLGVEASMISNVQGSSKSQYMAANLHNVSLQIPVAKNMGLGFSVAPYSSVGYNLSNYEKDVDMGLITYNFSGEGDITEVKLGFGMLVAKGLSVGVAAKYYWGLLDRYFALEITPITSSDIYSTAQGLNGTYISNVKAQVGVQWDAIFKGTKRLTFGATYDLGGDISPEMDLLMTSGSSVDVAELTAIYDFEYPALNFPHQVVLGATYRDRKWHMAADYTLQMWNNSDDVSLTTEGVEVGYNNVSVLKLGAEYTPNVIDSRKYINRASYRVGLRAGNYYQTFGGEMLPQWAVTAGVGLPMNLFGMSNIDIGVEYGGLGQNKTVGSMKLVKQNYLKISLGATLFGNDYWFQRIKYD